MVFLPPYTQRLLRRMKSDQMKVGNFTLAFSDLMTWSPDSQLRLYDYFHVTAV
jgi:hypothetical protein